MKPKRIWILVADAGQAVVYEQHGATATLTPVEDMNFCQDLPASRDILADRPGRTFDSSGYGRHAMENPSDPHRELKRSFARTVCEALSTRSEEFDRLVLVAAPQMLGDLREALPESLREKIAGELAKDFVKVPQQELLPRLHDVLIAARRTS